MLGQVDELRRRADCSAPGEAEALSKLGLPILKSCAVSCLLRVRDKEMLKHAAT